MTYCTEYNACIIITIIMSVLERSRFHDLLPQVTIVGLRIEQLAAVISSRNSLSQLFTHGAQVNSAFHPSGVDKCVSAIRRGKGVRITCVGWQVILCDPI